MSNVVNLNGEVIEPTGVVLRKYLEGQDDANLKGAVLLMPATGAAVSTQGPVELLGILAMFQTMIALNSLEDGE